MLKVKISIDDGNGKKAEIELSDSNDTSKLIIIQQVFSLFGVDNDVMEMTKTYQKVGAAYSSFFKTVDDVNELAIEKLDSIDIKQQLSDALNENQRELETTYKTIDDHQQPDYVTSGMKTNEDGTKRYKLYYICDSCSHRGNHYIYQYSKDTWCHSCKQEMAVYYASPEPMERDTRGNFFRAGEYKDKNLAWTIG